MNYQKEIPTYVINILKDRKVPYFDIAYYAWPQMFSSTSGPRGGIGGQAISSFTVEAYVCDDAGPTVYICSGMYSFYSRFEPFKNVKSWIHINKELK